ncbi:MAG TPA: ABC transporter permease subunit [Thermoanaerobaculaceae bacterium]|nr:ABC transporter permease subunit [Thermoanaerobaculaceae bacterium]
MNARWPVVRTLFTYELRQTLRDRRTLFMSIVLPLLVMPIMLFGSRKVEQVRERKLEETTFSVAVTGSQAGPARAVLEGMRARLARQGSKPDHLRFELVTKDDPLKALNAGEVNLVIEAVSAAEARQRAEREEREARSKRSDRREEGADRAEADPVEDGAPVLVLVSREDQVRSQRAAGRMIEALRETRRLSRGDLLAGHGFPVAMDKVAVISETSLASAGQVAGLTLGRLLTLLLLLFILSGGSVVATDTLAGEKERGTLETLLTTAVARGEIVAAKFLLILSVAIAITVIQAVNLLLYVGFKIIPTSEGFSAAVTPPIAALVLLLFLPVAALCSGVLLLVSGRAKTYKEAQMLFFPVFLLGMVPAVAPFLPGLRLRSAIVAVPVANIAVAVKEVLTGIFDWPMLAVAFLVTAGAAAWALLLAARTLSTERLITASDADATQHFGGPTLLGRQVLTWFAVIWALVLVTSTHGAEGADIRLQVLLNLVLIFGGATALIIRHYRLDPREALALRAPHPAAWVATVLGAPAALLSGVGLFLAANHVVPVPTKLLESFGESLMPDTIPFWQMVIFLCVMPGVFEEMTFRGVLLHGLSRRFRPVAAALAVGAVFGLFHFSLFRLVPTGYLGVVLAAVTMLTGSIFPAMLWHAINNLLGLGAAKLNVSLADLPWTYYATSALVLALCFYILWRTRRPYPGLRTGTGRRPGQEGR